MAAVRAPESKYAQELAKFNQPYRFQPFPTMLYRARRSEKSGKPVVLEPGNDQWSMQNCITVMDEAQLERALRDGYRKTVPEAIELFEQGADDLARAAAERAYSDSRMSEAAQREAAAEQAKAPHKHLGEIPEQPIAPRKAKCSSPTKTGAPCKFDALEGSAHCKKHSH